MLVEDLDLPYRTLYDRLFQSETEQQMEDNFAAIRALTARRKAANAKARADAKLPPEVDELAELEAGHPLSVTAGDLQAAKDFWQRITSGEPVDP